MWARQGCSAEEQCHSPVSLPHALGVRRPDVLVHDLLPPPAAKPTPEEALDLLDLGDVRVFGVLVAAVAVLKKCRTSEV